MDHSDHPRRRVLIGIFVLLGVCITLLTPTSWFAPKGESTNQISELIVDTKTGQVYAPNEDPDADGIPNWEEALRGTNPKEKDVRPAPVLQVSEEDRAILNDPENLTANLAKNTFATARYATLAQNEPLSQEESRSISTQLLAESTANFKFKQKTLEAINIKKNMSLKEIRSLGNTIASTTVNLIAAHIKTDEIVLLNEIASAKELTDSVTKAEKALINKASAIDAHIEMLTSLPVPESMRLAHLNFINALMVYSETLRIFANFRKDAVKTSIALNVYKTTVQEGFNALYGYASHFESYKIAYLPNEPGFIFTNKQ